MKVLHFYIVGLLLLSGAVSTAAPASARKLPVGSFTSPTELVVLEDGTVVKARDEVTVSQVFTRNPDGSEVDLNEAIQRAIGDLNISGRRKPKVPFEIIVLPETDQFSDLNSLSRVNHTPKAWENIYSTFKSALIAHKNVPHKIKKSFFWDQAYLYDPTIPMDQVPPHLRGVNSVAASLHEAGTGLKKVVVGKVRPINFKRDNFTLGIYKSIFQGVLVGVTAFVIAEPDLGAQLLSNLTEPGTLMEKVTMVKDAVTFAPETGIAGAIMGTVGLLYHLHTHFTRQFLKYETHYNFKSANPRKWMKIDEHHRTQTIQNYLVKQAIVTGTFVLAMQATFSYLNIMDATLLGVLSATGGSVVTGIPFSRMFVERTDRVNISEANPRELKKILVTNGYSVLLAGAIVVFEALSLFSQTPEIYYSGQIGFGVLAAYGYHRWIRVSKEDAMVHIRKAFYHLNHHQYKQAFQEILDWNRIYRPFQTKPRNCSALFAGSI